MITLRDTLALLSLGATMLLAATPARAEEVGNATNGLAYARAHCAECHVVEDGDDIIISLDAPDFTSVANTPGMTPRALGVWLQTSHPTMPNFLIPTAVKDDLIAYIMSLKTKAPR
jgi:mono/diheme cytochrome c family protein